MQQQPSTFSAVQFSLKICFRELAPPETFWGAFKTVKLDSRKSDGTFVVKSEFKFFTFAWHVC